MNALAAPRDYIVLIRYNFPLRWKFGQLRPGALIRFERISFDESILLDQFIEDWIETVLATASGFSATYFNPFDYAPMESLARDPKLLVLQEDEEEGSPQVVFRQVRAICML